MSALMYPAGLPSPSAAPIESAERRLISPEEARAVQRDRLATQQITWPPLTNAEAEQLEAWGEMTLIKWGGKFGAVWPLPAGFVTGTRRFLKAPARQFSGGFWHYSAPCEVMGRGLVPLDGPPPVAGLFYTDFYYSATRRRIHDDPQDQTADPAAAVVGPNAVIYLDQFHSEPQPSDVNNSISWTAAKFNAIAGVDFNIQFSFSATRLPTWGGSSGRRLFNFINSSTSVLIALFVPYHGNSAAMARGPYLRVLTPGGAWQQASGSFGGGTIKMLFQPSVGLTVTGGPWLPESPGTGSPSGAPAVSVLPVNVGALTASPTLALGGGGFQGGPTAEPPYESYSIGFVSMRLGPD